MRVIAGSRRSMPLKTPKGMETRPTQDRTKETLFNVLQRDVPGCEFLDLFSGSGAIAIEALSRGAKHAVLVENEKNALACIKENLSFTKFTAESEVMAMDVCTALERLTGHEVFDIVFMDPPYAMEIEPEIFRRLSGKSYIDEETILVTEAKLKRDFSFLNEFGFEVYKVKEYKTNQHVFIKRKK